ncbi:ASST-domain-containing protein [Xylariales sp. AK1849]|nr:ASST-domain-containing protein [Xylariales sp. AK1849]
MRNFQLDISIAILSFYHICLADRTYKSRPDLSPPRLNITLPATHGVEEGFLFVAPYSWNDDGTRQSSPYILDNEGDLVWSGFGYFAPTAANFQPARWKSKNVLFAYEGTLNRFRGHGHGHHKILDQNYQTVREVRSAGHYLSDLHEFNIVGERTALVGSYTPREMDLKPYGGAENQTWIFEYVLQELDIETGDVLFEWHSLDHTSPKESMLPLGSMAGSGYDSSTAWDYIHINSIAKGDDGHYIASARSASTIYKINGTDGSILWRLGGESSDFELGSGVEFAFQHHARYVPGLNDTISLFENSAGSGSAGKIFTLDLTKRKAELKKEFRLHQAILAFSQGSTQLLPNGNALVNWGSADQITEFDADGEVIFHAFLESGLRQENTQNYRAFRGNWTGVSPERPAVVVETNKGGNMSVWVSWNGDTRTTDWRLSWNDTSSSDEKLSSSQVRRAGFETKFDLPGGSSFNSLYVEALDAKGNVLERSRLIAAADTKLDGAPTDSRLDTVYAGTSSEPAQNNWVLLPSEL